jgi:hypothetical protein
MNDNRSTRADARKRSHLDEHPNESLHAIVSVATDGDKADCDVKDFGNGQSLKRQLQRAVRGVAVPGQLCLRIQQMLREH